MSGLVQDKCMGLGAMMLGTGFSALVEEALGFQLGDENMDSMVALLE